ncbi:MAG: twin-arginine translocase subunit TatC [Chloroflexi bacterium]|nr:twin-arginine translocase subunit TatC [Chloroflexota bacterium]
MASPREMPFLSHINELKRRLMWSALFFIVTVGTSLAFHRNIIRFLVEPAEDLNAFTGGALIFTDLTEFWGAAVKISVLTGALVTMPFLTLQISLFLGPGLSSNERKWLYLLMPFALISFGAGVAFGYYVLIPPAINFLLNFAGDVATPLIRIGSYLNLVTMLLFWMGLSFELPVVMFFLAKIHVVTPQFFGSKRKYAVVGAFVVGAMITPTFDPFNQSLVAGPIIVLYEIGYWLARLGARRDKSESTEASSSA